MWLKIAALSLYEVNWGLAFVLGDGALALMLLVLGVLFALQYRLLSRKLLLISMLIAVLGIALDASLTKFGFLQFATPMLPNFMVVLWFSFAFVIPIFFTWFAWHFVWLIPLFALISYGAADVAEVLSIRDMTAWFVMSAAWLLFSTLSYRLLKRYA